MRREFLEAQIEEAIDRLVALDAELGALREMLARRERERELVEEVLARLAAQRFVPIEDDVSGPH